MQSLLLALRSLRKDLRVTATVLVLLSLGLGANAAIFAVADALVFRPPSGVDSPERVRRLHSTSTYTPDGSLETRTTFNHRELAELRAALAPRARLTAYVPDSVFAGPERSEKVRVTWVGRDYFDALGVTPRRDASSRPRKRSWARLSRSRS